MAYRNCIVHSPSVEVSDWREAVRPGHTSVVLEVAQSAVGEAVAHLDGLEMVADWQGAVQRLSLCAAVHSWRRPPDAAPATDSGLCSHMFAETRSLVLA